MSQHFVQNEALVRGGDSHLLRNSAQNEPDHLTVLRSGEPSPGETEKQGYTKGDMLTRQCDQKEVIQQTDFDDIFKQQSDIVSKYQLDSDDGADLSLYTEKVAKATTIEFGADLHVEGHDDLQYDLDHVSHDSDEGDLSEGEVIIPRPLNDVSSVNFNNSVDFNVVTGDIVPAETSVIEKDSWFDGESDKSSVKSQDFEEMVSSARNKKTNRQLFFQATDWLSDSDTEAVMPKPQPIKSDLMSRGDFGNEAQTTLYSNENHPEDDSGGTHFVTSQMPTSFSTPNEFVVNSNNQPDYVSRAPSGSDRESEQIRDRTNAEYESENEDDRDALVDDTVARPQPIRDGFQYHKEADDDRTSDQLSSHSAQEYNVTGYNATTNDDQSGQTKIHPSSSPRSVDSTPQRQHRDAHSDNETVHQARSPVMVTSPQLTETSGVQVRHQESSNPEMKGSAEVIINESEVTEFELLESGSDKQPSYGEKGSIAGSDELQESPRSSGSAKENQPEPTNPTTMYPLV